MVEEHYDVVVAGGGPAGFIAAVAAARMGARTVLIEKQGCLGGIATSGMVAQIYGCFFGAGRQIVAGIPMEFLERVQAAGGSTGFYNYTMAELTDFGVLARTFPFDPEVYKWTADDFVLEAGVKVYYHTLVTHVLKEGNRVRGVVAESNAGRLRLTADVVLDCTGDGAVAWRAGCEGLPQDEVQPMTLCFRMGNVDVQRFRSLPREEKKRLVQVGLSEGRLFWQGMSVTPTPNPGEVLSLISRVQGFDAKTIDGMTGAELEGRRQVRTIMSFLRERVPGFEEARLIAIAPVIGVRETRRIHGRAILDDETVLAGAIPDDTIALGAGPIDIHEAGGAGFKVLKMPENGPFGISYGCLLPKDVDGLLVAGRCLSAARQAYSAVRHMGNCMAMGHAAGVAAALSVKNGVAPHELPVTQVREVLADQGAYLE